MVDKNSQTLQPSQIVLVNLLEFESLYDIDRIMFVLYSSVVKSSVSNI